MGVSHSPFELGATLYMPATRTDILDVIERRKLTDLRSLVICLEDSVSENDLPSAFDNVAHICAHLAYHGRPENTPLVFIRPRHIDMGRQLLTNNHLTQIDGLVLPKFTLADLAHWIDILADSPLLWMPTLETADVFDAMAMRELAVTLSESPIKDRILALRIGGNDLMRLLGIRRSRQDTLYEGPLAYVFKMLVSTFGARHFALTAPVCELIDSPQLLLRELRQDIAHGLVGKTAIHPSQVPLIHSALRVQSDEYQDALRILNTKEAVFKSNGAMCEPATHHQWAKNTLIRARIYGVDAQTAPTEVFACL